MGDDDYGYFGSGSSGYAHYSQTHKACFGDNNSGGGSLKGGFNVNDVSWAFIGKLFLVDIALIVVIIIISHI